MALDTFANDGKEVLNAARRLEACLLVQWLAEHVP